MFRQFTAASSPSVKRLCAIARTRNFRTMATASQPGEKTKQGALVEAAMLKSAEPLLDIGVNLVDDAFDKVNIKQACGFQIEMIFMENFAWLF